MLDDPAEVAEQIGELGITGAFVAIGDMAARARLAELCLRLGFSLPTRIHPAACVSPDALIGQRGFADARIMWGAVVDELPRINAATVVSHHVHVGQEANKFRLGPGRLGAVWRSGTACWKQRRSSREPLPKSVSR